MTTVLQVDAYFDVPNVPFREQFVPVSCSLPPRVPYLRSVSAPIFQLRLHPLTRFPPVDLGIVAVVCWHRVAIPTFSALFWPLWQQEPAMAFYQCRKVGASFRVRALDVLCCQRFLPFCFPGPFSKNSIALLIIAFFQNQELTGLPKGAVGKQLPLFPLDSTVPMNRDPLLFSIETACRGQIMLPDVCFPCLWFA